MGTRVAFINTMNSIKAWPASERPRERLLVQGPQALTDAELLTLVLGASSRSSGVRRSGRLPRPRTSRRTVIGTSRVVRARSALQRTVKSPTAPSKPAGAPDGSGRTLTVTGRTLTITPVNVGLGHERVKELMGQVRARYGRALKDLAR